MLLAHTYPQTPKGGSAVRFTPSTNELIEKIGTGQPITIHRPHDGEIRPDMARNFAKRLGDKYGFASNVFVLSTKP